MKKFFTPSRIAVMAVFAACCVIVYASVLNAGGPPGGGYANDPGQSNCTSCHAGSLNPVPSNLTNLTLSTNKFTGGGYIPDSTYSLTIDYTQAGINRFGFQITALTKTGNLPAGNFTAGVNNSKVTLNVAGRVRQYIQHTGAGNGGGGAASWTFTWRAPANFTDSVVFYVVVNATNSDGNNTGDQIYAKTFTIGASGLLSTATINTSKPQVCVGDTMTYYGSGTNNPVSYRWKFQNGTPQVVTTQNVVRTYAVAGNFRDTLWVTNNKGESKPVSVLTQVVAAPSATITSISPNDTACAGDSITLTAVAGTGLRYRWSSGANDTLSTLNVKQGGSYTVTVTNAGGCSSMSSPANIVFVSPAPLSLTASLADTLCTGDTLLVSATPGFSSYDFFNNGTLVQSGTSNTYRSDIPGNYLITATGQTAFCSSTSANTISKVIDTRLPPPVVTCGTSTTSSVEFTWNAVPGATGYSISTDTGKTWATPNGTLLHTVNGLSFNMPVQLWVRAQRNGVCADGNAASLTCTSLPCSVFDYKLKTSDTLVCFGDSVQITVGDLSLSSYSISFNNGPFGTDTSFWYTPATANGAYIIQILDANSPSCPAFVIHDAITVDSVPAVNASLDATAVCAGKPIRMTVNNTYNIYRFYRNGSQVSSGKANTFDFTGLANGDQLQAGGINLQCIARSTPQSIAVFVPVKPGFTVTANNRDFVFTDTTTGIASRSWNFDDQSAPVTTATANHTYAVNGNFNVRLTTTDLNGCVDSASQQVQSQNVSVAKLNGIFVKVMPSPATDVLYIELSSIPEPVLVQLADITGKLVLETRLTDIRTSVVVRQLAAGVYTLRLQNNGEFIQQKILISR